jgi:multidrug efflux pump subunit AcrB
MGLHNSFLSVWAEQVHFATSQVARSEAGIAKAPALAGRGCRQAREFRDSSSNLALIFLLALAFIYLVLSAQFESAPIP